MFKEIENLKFGLLHNHSSYSDGFATATNNAVVAGKLKLDALGLTDHGTCAGLVEHWQACGEQNIKPILGSEFYTRLPEAWNELGNSRNSRSGRYHITFLTTSFEGYKRLIKINNAAHVNMEESRGKKYPIATFDSFEEFAGEGLIVLTGCVASATFHDELIVAEEYINFLTKTFGKNNVFAEIMPHEITRFDGQRLNGYSRPLQLAQRFGLKTVYTTDAHAAEQQQLELLRKYTLAMKGYEFTASFIQPKEEVFKEAVNVIGNAEAIKAFQGIDEIINRTEAVNFKRDFQLPHADDVVVKMKEYLQQEFQNDVETSGLDKNVLKARFRQEYDLLEKYSFWHYFAVLWDILTEARTHNVSVVARGSASGSYLLYLLKITQLHPVKHNLMFERFLAELRLERGELPDVDIDIPSELRGSIQKYAKERWGFEPVGTILTYSHSSAIRVINRIYSHMTGVDLPKNLVDAASDYDAESGYNKEEYEKFINIQPWMQQMYDGLQNNISGYGAHACAVVPVDSEMPVPMEGWGRGVVVNYSQSGSRGVLQLLGYVKYDLLSSENLSTLRKLEEITGVKCPKVVPDNDPCFTIFEKEDLTGLFQFDTRVGKNLINLMVKNGRKINNIRTLSDLTSLGRPGPLHENYHVSYAENSADISHHPEFIQEVFKQTNGVIVYQEQVAELFARVAFKDYDKTAKEYGIVALKSLVPKNSKMALTEKFQKGYKKMHDMFLEGGINYHELDVIYLEELFASLVGFVRYGFNLSHSLSYANISAQEAWYKFYHPSAFWSVILEGVSNNADERGKLMRFIVDATLKSGLKFKAPHINTASLKYSLNGNEIQCPISMIKGLGANAIADILSNQPFTSLKDLNERTKLNKTLKLVMFNAGMLDGLPGDLYDLGVCEIREFKVPEGGVYPNRGIIESIETLGTSSKVTIDGKSYIISENLSDKVIKDLKKAKLSPVTGVKNLKKGTEILFQADENVIIAVRRTKYYEPLPPPVDKTQGMKQALGFAIPSILASYFRFAEGKMEKHVGYIVDFEDKTTEKTVQKKIVLHDGKRFWVCVEDKTNKGHIIRNSEIKSLDDIKHLQIGDLVGITLVLSKDKTGNVMSYGQIKEIKVLA